MKLTKIQAGYIQNGTFRPYKPASQITDRAKRYRANNHVPAGKRCFACGSPDAMDVHHINGNESDFSPRNLTRSCRTCNVLAANTMRKAGLGIKTRQYNPRGTKKRARSHGAASLGAYLSAVEIVKGRQPGNVAASVKLIEATSPAQRSEYASEIWRIRRERYGPTGRQDSLPF